MNNQTMVQRDLKVLWHPCSQMKDHESVPLIPIKSGHGVWLEDFEGKRYLDAISSWWVNIFGHANPVINQAVKQQLDTLEHVILGGFTHEAAVALAEKLVEITPPGLDKCFYADNGSSAVEVALKMSFHYWRNLGKTQKTQFITLENSYHGETLGALAVGNVALYKETYAPLLMDVITVPGPDCYHRESGETWQDYSIRRFADMERALAKHADSVCAVIVEPLVQCAGSMRMYHPVYLTLLREACDRYGVHLIADEIAVGFGRTGTLFACEQAAISPDFICLSKGLTGGYLVIDGHLTLGQLVAAELIVSSALISLVKFGKHLEGYYDLMAGADKIGHLLDLPLEREQGVAPVMAGPVSLAVRGLSFGFGAKQPVFSNLTMLVQPGERVAVSGGHGSGKSTLAAFVCGLRQPGKGHIEINGVDLGNLRLEALRNRIAVVGRAELFRDSLFENVRLGRSELGRDEVEQALDAVGLLDDIASLEDGLDTDLSPSGAPLSAAQGRLLLLARAIAGRPALLIPDAILDEMDEETRRRIAPTLFAGDAPWTLLVLTGSPNVAALCGRVVELQGVDGHA